MTNNIRLFRAGDISGVVYAFFGNIGNFILVAWVLGSFGWPDEIVYGRVLPGIAVGLMFQGLYYAWMGYKLAKKENRDDVTALPSGVSTPAMFIFLYGVIYPLHASGLSPENAYSIALAACFLGGAVEMCGALIGPSVRKFLPRVAMLSTVAGIALVWMGTEGMFDVFALPILGMPVLIIAIIGLIGGYMLPGKIPPLLVSIVFGIVLALALGYSTADFTGVGTATLPAISVGRLIEGFAGIAPFLAVIIPVSIYNFVETMDNVESASAAGDNYNLTESMVSDGFATALSSVFGGIMPNTVWMGHPGLKKGGAGIGYSIIAALLYGICGFFGVFQFLNGLMPVVVIAVTFLWSAQIVITQAFADTPRRYGAAAVMGLIPHLADFCYTQVEGALGAFEIYIDGDVSQALIDYGVMWGGVEPLKQGAIITGMLWAAITAFIIDRRMDLAGHMSLVMAALSFFGFVHAPEIGIYTTSPFMIGYISVAVICYIFHAMRDKLTVPRRYDYL